MKNALRSCLPCDKPLAPKFILILAEYIDEYEHTVQSRALNVIQGQIGHDRDGQMFRIVELLTSVLTDKNYHFYDAPAADVPTTPKEIARSKRPFYCHLVTVWLDDDELIEEVQEILDEDDWY